MRDNSNTSFGNNSINIGKAYRVEVSYQNSTKTRTINCEKTLLKKMSIKPKNLTIFGLLGYGASAISYLSLFFKFPLWEIQHGYSIIVILLSFSFMSIAGFGTYLSRRGFIPVLRRYSIETDGRQVFMKKLKAKCPECSSLLDIHRGKSGVSAICPRNPESHKFEFDYTQYESS